MRATTIATFAALLLLAGACSDDDSAEPTSTAFPRQEVTVATGEAPPSPADVGVGDEIDPIAGGPFLPMDVAAFTEAWDSVAGDWHPDLVVGTWRVGYARPSGDFEHEWADWLAVYGTWSYDTGEISYAAVDWRYGPDTDVDLVVRAIMSLIDLHTDDQAGTDQVFADLGLDEVDASGSALDDLQTSATHGGVEFELYSDDLGGDLMVSAAS